MSSHYKKWGMGAGILAILGAILILVSLGLGWYQLQFSGNGNTITANYLPGSSASISCSGSECGFVPTGSHSYSSENMTNEGNLYMALLYMIIGAGVLGLLGAILTFLTPRLKGGMKWLPLIFVLLGLLISVGAVAYVAVGQPGAYKSDATSGGQAAPSGSWPGGSFSGSASQGVGGTETWGPGVGFYLGVVAVVLFLISMILMFMAWKGMKEGESMPPAAPAPATPPATPPGGM
jgi:hypothetical protein